jgi:hypothetical protein
MKIDPTWRAARRSVRRNSVRGAALVALGAWLAIASGCGDSSGLNLDFNPPPEGTTVDVSALQLAPVPAGAGVVHASAAVSTNPAVPPTLADDYTEVEFLLSGSANTYFGPATGPAEVASTGNAFVTRVIARFPTREADFSGRVFLEPFNTTSGPDRDVIWLQAASLLQENGDAWVGISVRSTSATELQAFDPVRYAGLAIPTNDTVWDMLRQLGAVLRTGGEQSPLPGHARYLYMGGYSQSGVDTATFSMAFHRTAELLGGDPIFDGYFPAAHAATMTPLQSGSGLIFEFEEGPMQAVDVPVVDLETQHDAQGWTREVLPGFFYTSPGGASVRRPDADSPTDKYRLFEITGASHSSARGADCGGEPSSFPGPLFVRAALQQLFRWAEDGSAPAEVDRIEMDAVDIVSTPSADEAGNARGGVRSPFVDVPLVRYQVVAGGAGLACAFVGTETALPADVLASRYGDAQTYLEQFTERLDATIAAGHLLEADRAEILEDASAKAGALLPAGG